MERILDVTRRTGYWESEVLHTSRDGRQITVASRWAILRDVWGEGVGILEINDDITARKKAEAALGESEQQLQSYIEQAGDAVYVLDGDTGRILNANTGAMQMMAYTRAELLQLSAVDIECQYEPSRSTSSSSARDRESWPWGARTGVRTVRSSPSRSPASRLRTKWCARW